VKLRYLPELRFREDQGVVQGLRIEEVIRGLHEGDRP
jgi:ribosome-binding factor A